MSVLPPSIHGLFPANPLGPDPTTYKQATLLNPDGTAGPVKCAACHVVDAEGVPTNVNKAMFVLFPDDEYPTRYDKAVGLSHILRMSSTAFHEWSDEGMHRITEWITGTE